MEQKIARVHSFESFGAVDGPGLRFVIFMQGCALRCKYCHNRDTWDLNGGMEYTSDELVAKILRYKNYFSVSGGGVTVSGGEPLLQLDFLIELFTKLKENKIHTAIDTSGSFTITENLKELIDLTDLFLLDIKCINDEICKDLTGVSNKKELEFARYLSEHGKDMWIRQVLVPGYTDKEENTDYNKGKRNFNVTINGIKCNDIESKNIQIEKDEKESDLKVYELKYIKDVTHSNEYILLGLYGYLPTSKSITYYVIDTSAQIIGKFECTNATEFILDDKTLEMEINEDNVIDYKFDGESGNVAKHKYTVQNSKVIDTIIEVYDKSRVVRAGASV